MPPDRTRQGRTVAIVNPGSGSDDIDALIGSVSRFFDSAATPGDVRMVGARDDIAQMARRAVDEGAATVVAVGGDGTVSTVAEILAGTGTALGVVPAGTFNYFARGLGVPQDPEAALQAIAEGTVRPVTLGRINGRVFLNNASVGIYSRIRRQRERTYRRFGRSRLAAYWSVLAAIVRIYRPMRLRLTVDGHERRLKSSLVFVANSAYQIEQFGMDGADAVRAGLLAVYVSRDTGRWHLIKQAVRLALNGIQRGRDFELITGREIVLDTRRPWHHVVRDGELARLRGPFRFESDPQALRVIVPKDTAP
ncbi:diacylglycerol kinase family protein [Psychromarinibacter sp. C21-152]|uniref:Diacylglycerol kinase family protein n=1 Tax=Psychromarinibacter sediminicola TaxID=3033385 RepID=A0AAE3TA93_9RHOB|nr:diacylglycerol kinase family protein [Psychromarinibacter sediminicola]MDF0602618.1 diacylglycerol kinase family protein [Psychromarinibacter sediminicola]